MVIQFKDAAEYYQSLPHQNKAWEFLQQNVPYEVLEEFAELYRNNHTQHREMRLLTQRDNKGDLNRDGRPDWYQTCNVTSCAMVIEYLTGRVVDPQAITANMVKRGLSIYSHANLVQILGEHGVKSVFSTSTNIQDLVAHLDKKLPVIWSNKLTHGGHLNVLANYDKTQRRFLIYDPYGEPTKIGGKWVYKDVRRPYWLSLNSFSSATANTATKHWAHLCHNM